MIERISDPGLRRWLETVRESQYGKECMDLAERIKNPAVLREFICTSCDPANEREMDSYLRSVRENINLLNQTAEKIGDEEILDGFAYVAMSVALTGKLGDYLEVINGLENETVREEFLIKVEMVAWNRSKIVSYIDSVRENLQYINEAAKKIDKMLLVDFSAGLMDAATVGKEEVRRYIGAVTDCEPAARREFINGARKAYLKKEPAVYLPNP